MTKYRTTDREQRENNGIVLGFCYCEIQNITRYLRPNAYTCGVYGWRADFYEFDGFTVSTGYSPLRFIYKSGYKDIDAHRKAKAEVLQNEFQKLENKLKCNFYKWQRESGSWHLGNKKVNQLINRIIKKANNAGEKAAEKYTD